MVDKCDITKLDEEDRGLFPEDLDFKYNPDGDGEHPVFTREDWRQAVSQQETLCGYWLWVTYQIEIFEG